MLKERIITALILLPLVLAAVFLAPSWLFDAVIGVVIALMALEFFALCGASATGRVVLVAVMLSLYALSVRTTPQSVLLGEAVVVAALLLWLLAIAWLFVRVTLPGWVKAFAGVVMLAGAGIALHDLKFLQPDGRWVFIALLIVWAADVGAYAAGRLFGRHKLAPAISPGKTWEGVAGGVLLVMAVAAVADIWLVAAAHQITWYLLLFVTTLISIAGDLFESLLKRQAGVKDSGRLLPGHGGLLDRLDSLLAVAPVFLYVGVKIGIFGELSAIAR